MEYAVQDIKVSDVGRGKHGSFKTGFYVFLYFDPSNSNIVFSHSFFVCKPFLKFLLVTHFLLSPNYII